MAVVGRVRPVLGLGPRDGVVWIVVVPVVVVVGGLVWVMWAVVVPVVVEDVIEGAGVGVMWVVVVTLEGVVFGDELVVVLVGVGLTGVPVWAVVDDTNGGDDVEGVVLGDVGDVVGVGDGGGIGDVEMLDVGEREVVDGGSVDVVVTGEVLDVVDGLVLATAGVVTTTRGSATISGRSWDYSQVINLILRRQHKTFKHTTSSKYRTVKTIFLGVVFQLGWYPICETGVRTVTQRYILSIFSRVQGMTPYSGEYKLKCNALLPEMKWKGKYIFQKHTSYHYRCHKWLDRWDLTKALDSSILKMVAVVVADALVGTVLEMGLIS